MEKGQYVVVEFASKNIQAARVEKVDAEEQLVLVDNKKEVPHIVKWVPEEKCKVVKEKTLRELGML